MITPNQIRTAAPLGSWTVRVIEASQARHDMVFLNDHFRFAKVVAAIVAADRAFPAAVAEPGRSDRRV